VVEASVKIATVVRAAAAVAAVAYLSTMVVTGALPRHRPLAPPEAQGLLVLLPERVTAVAVGAEGRSLVFERIPTGGWASDDGTPLAPEAAKRLSTAVQFLHTSAPVRVLTSEARAAVPPSDFGLERPALSVALFEGRKPVLVARFGGPNPDGFLQYVALDDRRELFLLSRFVGEEWAAAVAAARR